MGEEVKKKKPNHQMLWTAPDGWGCSTILGPMDAVNSTYSWGIISSTIGKITCEKCPKSRMGEEVKKKN